MWEVSATPVKGQDVEQLTDEYGSLLLSLTKTGKLQWDSDGVEFGGTCVACPDNSPPLVVVGGGGPGSPEEPEEPEEPELFASPTNQGRPNEQLIRPRLFV